MTIRMLVFDFRESEEDFFKNKEFEDFDISFFAESLNEKSVGQISQKDKDETVILSVFINSNITREILDEFKNLRMIATRSTGVNHIDLVAASEKNIAVMNVDNYGSTTVVQFTWGLIIALVRKIYQGARDIKKVDVKPNCYAGRDLKNLTLGVIGTGAIGAGMCHIANAFGVNVLACDMIKNKALVDNVGVKYTDYNSLLQQSDIITLHLPLTEDNYHMLSDEQFKIMKKTAYVINTSRGELIDTDALYRALTEGQIQGAALDVVECENVTFHNDDLLSAISGSTEQCLAKSIIIQRLAEMPNVIVTPHIAYDTKDAIETILDTTFINIKDCLQGGHSNWVN